MTNASLLAHWEGRPAAVWQAAWELPELEIHSSITSTSDRARDRAAHGAAAGTLVMAEQQLAGRGRHGRPWFAPAGSSLLMSFVLRPARAEAGLAPGTAPLRIGMAVADAITRVTGVECGLKWPNDIVVPGRGKLVGILCEAVTSGEADAHVIAGIGVNVRQTAGDWPSELRGHATSADACTGRSTDRTALAAAIIAAVRPLFDASLMPLSAAELRAFTRRDALRDQVVRVDGSDGDMTGVARGVDPDGALIIEADARVHRITNASLRLAGSAGAAYP